MLIKAFAKVNLTLDVTGKRSDGYHDLRSLMHTIDLYDEVELIKSDAFSFECNEPLPSDNTAMRAAMRYFTAAGLHGGVHILLTKHIPSEAGLGGASADAAGVLPQTAFTLILLVLGGVSLAYSRRRKKA